MRSEKEKMINGEMYLSADETLVNERINARRLTRMYNNTIETEIERRREILEELLGQVLDKPLCCKLGGEQNNG